MARLIFLIGLIFGIMSIVGLINPKIVLSKWGEKINRFQTFMIFISLFLAFVIGGSSLQSHQYNEKKKQSEIEDTGKKIEPQQHPKTEITPKPETVVKAPEEKPKENKKTDSQAAAPKPVEMPSPQVAKTAKSEGISVSYDQIMVKLSNYFTMEKSILNDNKPRYSGRTSDSSAILEIIGDKKNIDSATLIIAIPTDSPSIREQNSVLTVFFIGGILPEWKDSTDWITQAFKDTPKSVQKTTSKVIGAKQIIIKYNEAISSFMIMVQHK